MHDCRPQLELEKMKQPRYTSSVGFTDSRDGSSEVLCEFSEDPFVLNAFQGFFPIAIAITISVVYLAVPGMSTLVYE
ncbi:hypothetical protein QJS10_CPA05g02170 [Acorus calamus]|uniref:Uncharacterized protein n=1 Tax=Acorus calamus TaxID=4465 RepID=A0AAV9EPP7_ACOCL|nr:hypothetical protein QJS10_CPA05g02170 [Acorus calamus]